METKTTEYNKFLAKKIQLGDQAIREGRTYTAEQAYENAIRAALRAAEDMKKHA